MRVVLDTNILLSALLRRDSPGDLIRRVWEDGAFTLVTSEWQLEELRRASRYPRLARFLKPHEVGRLVGRIRIRGRADVLETLPSVDVSPDPDDDPIIAAALAGEAAWLVTRNKRDLLALGNVQGVRITTAGEFDMLS